ncbi:glutathione S-transferase [Variovorax paradoxus]|uniref:hypothetical protein n=1 Tax=Variovorax paradoxus TaxID=34073 RepID=UPI002793DE3A|nr:hypothetical protein [Variovorax paradoxus]MDQ0568985.1 glutathione S-transferase [Variovorax paradoxus]
MSDDVPATNTPLPPSTAPDSFNICGRGFGTEEEAREVCGAVGAYVREFGRVFDLSALDGLTVAGDYAQALSEFDRGVETANKLAPTEGHVVGVAMTPCALRDGVLKSHIFINAAYALPLKNEEDPDFPLAVHLLAHECAHVDATTKFDTAFPGVSLRMTYPDVWKQYRGRAMMACWDEYAATHGSALFGRVPADDYEESFLGALERTRPQANEFIANYRTHRRVDQALDEVYTAYAELLKLAAYLLGDLDGADVPVPKRARTTAALDGHWFRKYFDELHTACRSLWAENGRWTSMAGFEAIADICDRVVAEGGLHPRYMADGQVFVGIP